MMLFFSSPLSPSGLLNSMACIIVCGNSMA